MKLQGSNSKVFYQVYPFRRMNLVLSGLVWSGAWNFGTNVQPTSCGYLKRNGTCIQKFGVESTKHFWIWSLEGSAVIYDCGAVAGALSRVIELRVWENLG